MIPQFISEKHHQTFIPFIELRVEDLETRGERMFKEWLQLAHGTGLITGGWMLRKSTTRRRPDFYLETSEGGAFVEIKDNTENSALVRAEARCEVDDEIIPNVTEALENRNFREQLSSSEGQHKAILEEMACDYDFEHWTVVAIDSKLPGAFHFGQSRNMMTGETSEPSFDRMDRDIQLFLYGNDATTITILTQGQPLYRNHVLPEGYFPERLDSVLDYVGVIGRHPDAGIHIRFFPKLLRTEVESGILNERVREPLHFPSCGLFSVFLSDI